MTAQRSSAALAPHCFIRRNVSIPLSVSERGWGRGCMPAARHIIVGQHVDRAKRVRATELRQQMTEAERLLWAHLRRNQLGGLHFRRQQVIDGLIVDFYCHSKGLVVEVDGGIHQEQQSYDRERDRVMAHRGLRVLRLGNHDVMSDLRGALQRIADACKTQPT